MGLAAEFVVGEHGFVILMRPGPLYMLGWSAQRLWEYAHAHGWTIHT